MATLIFRLNNVDFDEAEEVRQLLADNDLDFYETNAGRWGISVAGIWLVDESRVEQAKALLQDYARERQQQVRNDYQAACSRGEVPSLWQRVQRAPVFYLGVAVLAAAILYLSIWPFLDLGG